MYDDGPYDHSIGIYTWGDTIAIGYTCNRYPNAFTHNYELGVPTATWDCLHGNAPTYSLAAHNQGNN